MNRLLVLLALAGAAICAPSRAEAFQNTSKEYQVKAAFLFHFAQFVEWPDSAFSRPEDPFVIGILGADPFGGYLDEVVRGEKIGARAITVKRYDKAEDVKGCQILFVSGSDLRPLPHIFGALGKRPILTVGEAEDFSRSGGMIRFNMQQNKIRLKVNVEASQTAGLSISSKLLSLADIVAPGKE